MRHSGIGCSISSGSRLTLFRKTKGAHINRISYRRPPHGLVSISLCLYMAYGFLVSRASGQETREPALSTLTGCTGQTVRFSPDGSLLLTVGIDDARVWSATTFKPLTPPLHDAGMGDAVFARGGNAVFTTGKGRLWDSHTGQLIAGPFATDETVVAVNREASLVVMRSKSTMALHQVVDGKTIGAVGGGRDDYEPDFAVFSPDGARLLTSEVNSAARPSVRAFHLWDLRSFGEVGRMIEVTTRGPYNPYAGDPAAFGPDGKLFAVREECAFDVYAALTFQKVAAHQIPLERVWDRPESWGGIAFTKNGRWLLLSCNEHTSLWDASTAQALPGGIAGLISGWEVNPDGTRVICTHRSFADNARPGENELAIWDLATGALTQRLLRGGGGQAAFSPDGKLAAGCELNHS
jgi:WD40 repeat protein